MRRWRQHGTEGSSIVTYIVLVALIAIGALIAIATVGTTMQDKFQTVDMRSDMVVSTPPLVTSPTPLSTGLNLSTDPGLELPAASPGIQKNETTSLTQYSGTLLAGTAAPLLDFTKADFDAAVHSGNLVILYFYANWCPICKEEFPTMQSVFNELSTDGVVGFRVNFNDNQTDADEKALAREHGIAYQHTKVLLKNGQEVLKSPETWDRNRYHAEISNGRAP